MRHLSGAVLALSGIWIGMSPTFAGSLDQSYVPSSGNGLIVESTQTVAQTFTVGITGLLSRVEVEVARNPSPPDSDLFLEIRSTLADGSPSGTILASHTFVPDDVPTAYDFIGFDLVGGGFAVTAGQVLSLVMTANVVGQGGIDPYAWAADAPGNYDGGDTYLDFNRGDGFTPLIWDVGFKTYVSAVPEPSGLCLMGLGVATLAALRRSRPLSPRHRPGHSDED